MLLLVYNKISRSRCAMLIQNIKAILNKEIKKEIDERVNAEKQQTISSKQVSLQIQNDVEELERYGRRKKPGSF